MFLWLLLFFSHALTYRHTQEHSSVAVLCRASNDEPPHVVIDVHADSPLQRGPAEAVVAVHQLGPHKTTAPLPIVLETQNAPEASQDR